MNPEQISVIIIEDDKHIREGIAELLESTPGFKLNAVFENCEKALRQLKENLPDVILMDISMPGMNGIECVKKITAKNSEIKIIMLTVYEEEQKIFDSLRAGASGYILKRSSLQEILSSIKEVMNGGGPMSPVIANKVLNYFNKSGKKSKEINLTNRENEILKELVEGHSYKKISEKLFISLDTVRSHIKGVYQKLHVNSKTEAVAKALKENLL
jgi:DNA-binding NarL/FixJ family response regulator